MLYLYFVNEVTGLLGFASCPFEAQETALEFWRVRGYKEISQEEYQKIKKQQKKKVK